MKTSVKNLPTLFPELTLSDYQLTATSPVTDDKPITEPTHTTMPAPPHPAGRCRSWHLADIAGLAFLAIFYGYLMLHL